MTVVSINELRIGDIVSVVVAPGAVLINSETGRPFASGVATPVTVTPTLLRQLRDGDLSAVDVRAEKDPAPEQLLAWAYAQVFRIASATRDANGAITVASIVWPNGATGELTVDTASTAFPGAIDAWHATHVLHGVTHTVTQPAVTRDGNGAVISQPAITIV